MDNIYIENNHELQLFLQREQAIESTARRNLRINTIQWLQNFLNMWLRTVLKKKKGTIATHDVQIKLYAFGSYRLGVSGPNDDIDLLCICPSYVNRYKHFFQLLYNMLVKFKRIQSIVKIPFAHVPIIKIEINGIKIDLLFASVNMQQLPKNNLNLADKNILIKDDELSRRSINGFPYY